MRASNTYQLYQIEVIDFKRRDNKAREPHKNSSLVYFNGIPQKQADIPFSVPSKTLVNRFKNSETAKKWGARFGTVISCFKVDKMPYLENIEHLNLNQEPINIMIEKDEFNINTSLEINSRDKHFNIEIVDK